MRVARASKEWNDGGCRKNISRMHITRAAADLKPNAEVDQSLEIRLLHIRQQVGMDRIISSIRSCPLSIIRRQHTMSPLIVMQSQSDLFQVVLALSSSSRLARLLNGWQQQRNKNCDDRNDDEEFDQRESTLLSINRRLHGMNLLEHRSKQRIEILKLTTERRKTGC